MKSNNSSFVVDKDNQHIHGYWQLTSVKTYTNTSQNNQCRAYHVMIWYVKELDKPNTCFTFKDPSKPSASLQDNINLIIIAADVIAGGNSLALMRSSNCWQKQWNSGGVELTVGWK